MSCEMKSRFGLNATMVANEFIDRYMAVANGEYVKVYLYLLRHQDTDVTVVEIADALNHTEADVRRALAYWTRLGVLMQDKTERKGMQQASGVQERTAEYGSVGEQTAECGGGVRQRSAGTAEKGYEEYSGGSGLGRETEEEAVTVAAAPTERTHYTPEQVARLAKESEFTQLLYISQKYMNKVFTPRECEVFAYLYDGLHMSVELLEYLVEYCVQGNHYSIRYLETVALNWNELGIKTVDKAKQHTASFSNDAFAVMKAFGLNDRRPGDSEMALIRKWFGEWGFTRELVLEACARTLKSIHNPSFSYADKILAEWRKSGARTMADVKKLDEKRDSKKGSAAAPTPSRGSKNQFHNFEQRNTNYDAMVLERLKQRLGDS